MAKLGVRKATANDVALILKFIKKLAEYENMLDLVVADESLLKEWIFDKNKAEVLFATKDGVEVGFALYFHNFSIIIREERYYTF